MVVVKSPPRPAIWGSFPATAPTCSLMPGSFQGLGSGQAWRNEPHSTWCESFISTWDRRVNPSLLTSSQWSARAAASSQRTGHGRNPDGSAACLGRVPPLPGLGCPFPRAASGSEAPEPACTSVLSCISLTAPSSSGRIFTAHGGNLSPFIPVVKGGLMITLISLGHYED